MSLFSNDKLKKFIREYDILLVFAVFLIACIVITDGKWLALDNVLNVISRVSILGILAMGQCIVILSGQMDLSMASYLALFCSIYALVFVGGYGIIVALVLVPMNAPAMGPAQATTTTTTTRTSAGACRSRRSKARTASG